MKANPTTEAHRFMNDAPTMTDPMHELDQIISKEMLDQVVRDSHRQWPTESHIEWGTIEDLDAAAWDDLTRALKDKDRDRGTDPLG